MQGDIELARQIQNEICRIIYQMCRAQGNLYAVMKEIIRRQGGPDVGSVRAPLPPLAAADAEIVAKSDEMIRRAVEIYCS